jgi:crossover junction endodeoxyribonuclease RusA
MPKKTNCLEFTIKGPPIPKDRPRFVSGRVVSTARLRRYEKHVGMIAEVSTMKNPGFRQIIEQPNQLFVDLWIYNLRSFKSAPDPDNIIKSVLDGMEGIIYENDRQVLPRVQAVEYECEQPRVELRIEVI